MLLLKGAAQKPAFVSLATMPDLNLNPRIILRNIRGPYLQEGPDRNGLRHRDQQATSRTVQYQCIRRRRFWRVSTNHHGDRIPPPAQGRAFIRFRTLMRLALESVAVQGLIDQSSVAVEGFWRRRGSQTLRWLLGRCLLSEENAHDEDKNGQQGCPRKVPSLKLKLDSRKQICQHGPRPSGKPVSASKRERLPWCGENPLIPSVAWPSTQRQRRHGGSSALRHRLTTGLPFRGRLRFLFSQRGDALVATSCEHQTPFQVKFRSLTQPWQIMSGIQNRRENRGDPALR